jgi:hypothetical protein
MKFIRGTGVASIFLLLGTMIPAYAQHEGEGDKHGKSDRQEKGGQQQGRSAQQQGRHAQQAQPPRAQQQQERAQQPQQWQRAQQPQQQPQRPEQQARAWQQNRGWLQQGGWEGHDTWQEGRARRWSTDHRTWAQRGGYGGYYIPQNRFNLYFGSRHFFRVRTRPVMYLGYPRFEYGGISFLLVDPFPEYWADNWYDVNDLYISYNDGYYLHNRSYPQVRLAIAIVQ